MVFSNSKYIILVCACVFTVVISGPGDVTVCEGRSATFTCVLQDSRLTSDNVQWLRGTTTAQSIDPQDSNIHFATSTTNNTLTSSLNITNAVKSYAGYYFVGTPYYSVCRASLTVTTSM